MRKAITGVSAVVLTLAGLAAMYSYIPFGLHLIYQIFVDHQPVWSTTISTLVLFLLFELLMVIIIALFGGLAMFSLSKKGSTSNRWKN